MTTNKQIEELREENRALKANLARAKGLFRSLESMLDINASILKGDTTGCHDAWRYTEKATFNLRSFFDRVYGVKELVEKSRAENHS
jgi:hypothetical protein